MEPCFISEHEIELSGDFEQPCISFSCPRCSSLVDSELVQEGQASWLPYFDGEISCESCGAEFAVNFSVSVEVDCIDDSEED